MEYIDVARARDMDGLRLALTQGVPGPWSEAAKAVFRLRHVPFVAVAQKGGGENPELVDWTGHRNAPVAVYNRESPRVRWLEIVELAQRLGRGPNLLPQRIEERMSVVGLVNEMAGESGFAWHGRILMLAAAHKAGGDAALQTPMFKDYGYTPGAEASSISKVREFLDYLAERIKAQRAIGSDYLVGDELSAADVYWAYFSQLLDTYPTDKNPMPDFLRQSWGLVAATIGDFDAVLTEQRDTIFERHLELPLSF